MTAFRVLGIAAALLGGAAAVLAQQAPESYHLARPDARTGSNIRQRVVSGSDVPLDKTYAELSAEHRARVRALYEALAADDEPPFPADGLKPVYSAMADLQHHLLVKGRLTLVASVGADGDVTAVQALGSPDADMVRAAANVLMLTKFKPATCKGKPCAMDFPFRFNFDVEP
jgi:hypothetical protein